MDATNEQEQNQPLDENNIPQIKMENLKNSFNFIHSVLNKCVSKGLFTLDDAYLTKINLNNIHLGINTLEKYQNLFMDTINKEKK